MDNKVIVDAAGLQQVASQMKANSEKISTLYNTDIVAVLKACEQDLRVSGLDYSNVDNTFKKMFTGLTEQIDALVDALNNKIIPEYEFSAQYIAKMFNSEFANQMTEYLNTMSKD